MDQTAAVGHPMGSLQRIYYLNCCHIMLQVKVRHHYKVYATNMSRTVKCSHTLIHVANLANPHLTNHSTTDQPLISKFPTIAQRVISYEGDMLSISFLLIAKLGGLSKVLGKKLTSL